MSDRDVELYRSFTAAQERRAYFLIAAAGAAIAFAVTRTEGAVWSNAMLPWAGAVVCWAFSFFCGLRHMAYAASSAYSNFELLKVESGRHPNVGNVPQLMAIASEGIRSAVAKNAKTSGLFAQLQFGFLVLGGGAFLAWHIYEMYLRSIAPA